MEVVCLIIKHSYDDGMTRMQIKKELAIDNVLSNREGVAA